MEIPAAADKSVKVDAAPAVEEVCACVLFAQPVALAKKFTVCTVFVSAAIVNFIRWMKC